LNSDGVLTLEEFTVLMQKLHRQEEDSKVARPGDPPSKDASLGPKELATPHNQERPESQSKSKAQSRDASASDWHPSSQNIGSIKGPNQTVGGNQGLDAPADLPQADHARIIMLFNEALEISFAQ